jgi:hypothetical protein
VFYLPASAFIQPLLSMIFAQQGAKLLSNIFQTPDTPMQGALGGTNQAFQQLLPQLQQQAMGIPSMATQNTVRNLGTEINKAQQSYAASMQRASPGMISPTTPVRAGQGRLQEARIQGTADILGQAQQNAQNALLNIYGQSLPYQQQTEMQARQDQQALYAGIGSLWNDYKSSQNDPEFVQTFKPLMQGLIRYLQGLMGGQGQSSGISEQIDSGLENYTSNRIFKT